jgi:PAS domain S-box-containing protein
MMVQSDIQITAENAVAVLQQTPNGVLIVDRNLRVRFVNPSFRTMFDCEDEELLGRPAAELVHSDCFERALTSGGKFTLKKNIQEHGISFRASIFPIEGGEIYCGIFIDISEEETARRHLVALKAQTLERAKKVISKQMKTAQEIAGLLGETTAETKVLLVKLMSLFEEEHEQ